MEFYKYSKFCQPETKRSRVVCKQQVGVKCMQMLSSTNSWVIFWYDALITRNKKVYFTFTTIFYLNQNWNRSDVNNKQLQFNGLHLQVDFKHIRDYSFHWCICCMLNNLQCISRMNPKQNRKKKNWYRKTKHSQQAWKHKQVTIRTTKKTDWHIGSAHDLKIIIRDPFFLSELILN